MNREDAALLVSRMDVIKAYAEGAEIERREKKTSTRMPWLPCGEPSFNSSESYEYRVKPKPREIYVNEYNGVMGNIVYPTVASAEKRRTPYPGRTIKFREVLE